MNDFIAQQLSQVDGFAKNLSSFRDFAVRQLLDAAIATFSELGFNYDDYESELAAIGAFKGRR